MELLIKAIIGGIVIATVSTVSQRYPTIGAFVLGIPLATIVAFIFMHYAGVDVNTFKGMGSLYKVNPLSKGTTPLLTGTIEGQPVETIAWVNETKYGGKAFYTSLGHVDDFTQPAMNRLLKNAILWAADKEIK